jgi:non-specific serine/threonine protein kinase
MFNAGQEIGPYSLIKRIGRGGFGEVWLAERRAKFVTTKFAVKLPLDEQVDVDAVKNEAVVWEQASGHPNVLPIIEADEYDGQVVIVSEYAPDGSLSDVLQNKQPLELKRAVELTIGILNGLDFLHSRNVIHRDLKPANILLQGDVPRLADFGISRVVKNTEISVNISGTPSYMAPEAFARIRNVQTDLWSMGVILYELINGVLPFPHTNLTDLFGSIMKDAPAPFVDGVPAKLQVIVLIALSKEPTDRFRSASAMREVLSDFLAGLRRPDRPNLEETIANDPWPAIMAIPVKDRSVGLSHPTNLTESSATIVGREKEILELHELLDREDVRLVTMTGIGGTGKTTLSRATAVRLLDKFADGVFFVGLDAITNLELVAPTIAEPFGLKESGATPIIETLKDHLCDKQLLLVLDNFEQVTAAAPQIGELLSAAPKLKIIVTSRIPLRLKAEHEFVVPPLSVPHDASHTSLEELAKYESVRLFVARATRAKDKFALTDENAQSVAEICGRLDGLPLAIELAAARVKILSPQAILSKLENRLNLLTGGSSDLPDRQQTMRGSLEWSYDLLTGDERQLFRHLSVFAGGFTVEAAETVCRRHEEDVGRSQSLKMSIDQRSLANDELVLQTVNRLLPNDFDILDGIASLVDKSLLVAQEQSDGETRFRMLEVVREYALEALEAGNRAEAMFRSHAEFFLALGEEAEPHLRGARSAEWLDRLESEDDNLRATLAWSLENDTAMAARLAAALRYFWSRHDHLREGRKWLKAALEAAGPDVPSAVRFKLLNGLGLAARLQGDNETAKKAHEEGLKAGREVNDGPQIAIASRGLAAVLIELGDFEEASKLLDDGLVISEMLNDKFGVAVSHSMLGDLAQLKGDWHTARTHFDSSLAISRELDDKWFITSTINNLGFVCFNEGDHESALKHFKEALKISQELDNKIAISYSLDGIAAFAVKSGESRKAAQLSGVAEHLRESIRCEIEPAERIFRDAYLTELKTKMDEADFIKTSAEGRLLKLEDVIALCLK